VYRYSQNYTDVDHIDKYPLVPSAIDAYSDKIMSYRKVLPKNSDRYDGIEDNETHDLYALNRQSLLNQMNVVHIQAVAPERFKKTSWRYCRTKDCVSRRYREEG
jgi:hypothetical protein